MPKYISRQQLSLLAVVLLWVSEIVTSFRCLVPTGRRTIATAILRPSGRGENPWSDRNGTIEQKGNAIGPVIEQHQHQTPSESAEDLLLPLAPPVTYEKFMTMQEKRVVVTIRYSGGAGLKPYFLTVARKLKASHPDVLLDRLILPHVNNDHEEATFEVVVDGKVVVGNGRSSKQKVGQADMSHARSVFVSMQELDVAISRSRRKRRPSTTYGEVEPRRKGVNKLDVLQKEKKKMKRSMEGHETE